MGNSEQERDVIYEIEGQRFVWDRIKATSNKAKHGISFEEAASVFIIDGAERLLASSFVSFHLFCSIMRPKRAARR